MIGRLCLFSACVKPTSLGDRPADCFRRSPSHNTVMLDDFCTHRGEMQRAPAANGESMYMSTVAKFLGKYGSLS